MVDQLFVVLINNLVGSESATSRVSENQSSLNSCQSMLILVGKLTAVRIIQK